MERDYEEIFQKVLDYEQTLHEKNRKRIKIGLKCIWIVPLFFLALLFLTGSNKVIFLILWIVSLFALSIYLIVVEYMDHNLQEKIMELKGEEGTIEAVTPADFDRAAQIIRKTREMICIQCRENTQSHNNNNCHYIIADPTDVGGKYFPDVTHITRLPPRLLFLLFLLLRLFSLSLLPVSPPGSSVPHRSFHGSCG